MDIFLASKKRMLENQGLLNNQGENLSSTFDELSQMQFRKN